MKAFALRNSTKREVEVPTAPGERRVIGCRKVESHQPDERRQEPLGLAERQVEDEPEGQRGFDRQVGVFELLSTRAAGFHVATAVGDTHTVTSPRRTSARS